MSYYFGHSYAITQVIGYRELKFSFPNGYTAKVSRNCEYPSGDNWKVTLMYRGHEINDTAVSFNGVCLAKGKSTKDLSGDEIEAYLQAVKDLPVRHH